MDKNHTFRPLSRALRRWLGFVCAVAVLCGFPRWGGAEVADVNRVCLDCHTDPKLKRSGGERSRFGMVVDAKRFEGGVHGKMACLDCHVEQTSKLPHVQTRPRVCLDCHKGDDRDPRGVAFGAIERTFRSSIHLKRAPAVFSCTQCHDPHTFKRDITEQGILAHNQVCLRCHGSPAEFQALVHKPPPNLDKAHEWLPNRDMHWKHVRCLDCHSSYDPLSAHLILPKAKAVRRCESCHSSNSVLNLKLYRYRRAEEVQQVGFLNAAIINDAYVMGATRNAFLDFGALAMVCAMLLGISFHLLLRRWGARKQKAAPAATSERGHS